MPECGRLDHSQVRRMVEENYYQHWMQPTGYPSGNWFDSRLSDSQRVKLLRQPKPLTIKPHDECPAKDS